MQITLDYAKMTSLPGYEPHSFHHQVYRQWSHNNKLGKLTETESYVCSPLVRIEGVSIVLLNIARIEYKERETDKYEHSQSKDDVLTSFQAFLQLLGKLRVSPCILDPDGELKSDPVLHNTDRKLGTLLYPFHIPNASALDPVADEPWYAQTNCDGCEDVEEEDWQIFVLFLLDEYHSNVEQIED